VDRYEKNAQWLTYFRPCRMLVISEAYITPFLLEKGFSLSQVLILLVSIFSIAQLALEIPTGLFADRYGKALSIKISVPISATAQIWFGFAHQFWEFAICEALLGLAVGLTSGIEAALLRDSLAATGDEASLIERFNERSQFMNMVGYIGTAVGVPLGLLAVHFDLRYAVIFNGVLAAAGAVFAFRLVEPPRRSTNSQGAVRWSAWHATKQLMANVRVRWLVTLTVALVTATYIGYSLTAPYYISVGIPVIWFGTLLAIRSLWKAWLSWRFRRYHHIGRRMIAYAALIGIALLAMATGKFWLVWAVLLLDIVEALQKQPLLSRLNEEMVTEFRATSNSLVSLLQRIVFAVVVPLVGSLADATNRATGFIVTGCVTSTVAFVALVRLRRLQTFDERR